VAYLHLCPEDLRHSGASTFVPVGGPSLRYTLSPLMVSISTAPRKKVNGSALI